MKSRAFKRGFRTAAGISMAVAALLCVWSASARAGCSHYVLSGAHPNHLAYGLDVFDLGAGDEASNESPARPKPCTGALCSGKPAAPAPLSIALGRIAEEAAVLRLHAPPSPPAAGPRLAHGERIVRAVIEGPSIDRPPR